MPGVEEFETMLSKSKAGSLKVMDETRIFSVICHHGIIHFLINMVQSGELLVFSIFCWPSFSNYSRAKYPVAVANKLIHMFGSNILFAYDIGCTFSVMLTNSSIGEVVQDFNFQSCTGSFHGATHDGLCQLCFHIGLKKGAGIEDGEGNEQLFSASNALAAIICHATAYY